MKNWSDGPLVSFDLETTGVDVETARIVTASILHLAPAELETFEWLVDPQVEIPAEATAIHKITTEHAREHGRHSYTATDEITTRLVEDARAGLPIVVYNAPYDLTVLDRECRRHGLMTLHQRLAEFDVPLLVIDPLVLDRHADPYRKGSGVRKLTYLCQNVYGVPLTEEQAHGSTADALAAARVAWQITRRYPGCGSMGLPELQVLQTRAHRAWAENFGAWLREQGRPDDVERDWPIRRSTSGIDLSGVELEAGHTYTIETGPADV